MGQDSTSWQRASGEEIGNAISSPEVYRCSIDPFAHSYRNTSLARCNEMEKRRAYDERVREIEHGSFSPLVFSTSGGMGTTATVVYKRIASMIAEKYEKQNSTTIRCKLNFSLLRSCVSVAPAPHYNVHVYTCTMYMYIHGVHTCTCMNTMDHACSESLVSRI